MLLLLCWYCSVAKSCPTLCNPMDCRIPDSFVLHSLRICSNSCPLSWSWYLTISSSATLFSCLQSSLASGSSSVIRLFQSGDQSIGALATVLPLNIQDWFPLALNHLILFARGPQSSESGPSGNTEGFLPPSKDEMTGSLCRRKRRSNTCSEVSTADSREPTGASCFSPKIWDTDFGFRRSCYTVWWIRCMC